MTGNKTANIDVSPPYLMGNIIQAHRGVASFIFQQ